MPPFSTFIRAGVLAAASLLALAAINSAEAKVLATVDGVEITDDDVATALEDLGPNIPQDLQGQDQTNYVLDYLIDLKLVAKKAMDEKAADTPEFAREMAYYHDKVLMEGALSKVAAAAATDDALHKAYDDAVKAQAAATAGQPAQMEIHARHILVATKDEALAALKRVQAGEDFAKVANELSKDPSAQGGDLGWFTKDKMVPAFADAAFKLQPGQISDPVQTQFGWHIIQVEETRPAQAPAMPAFDAVKAQVQQYVVQKSQADLIAQLRSQSKIVRMIPDTPPASAAAPAPAGAPPAAAAAAPAPAAK